MKYIKILLYMIFTLFIISGCKKPGDTSQKPYINSLPQAVERAIAAPRSGIGGSCINTCKFGYAMVTVENIPEITSGSELFFCITGDNSEQYIGIAHRHKSKSGLIGAVDNSGVWQLEAKSSTSHEVHRWPLQSAHKVCDKKMIIAVVWKYNEVWAMNMSTWTPELPIDKWDIQYLKLEDNMSLGSVTQSCMNWGNISSADVTNVDSECLEVSTPTPIQSSVVLIYGDYKTLCDPERGTTRTPDDMRKALQEVKKFWHGVLGSRDWIIDGRCDHQSPWIKTKGKFDLNTLDENYFARIKAWADVHKSEGCVEILDLFDHYMMLDLENHPLHASNNIQHTFGIDCSTTDTFFDGFYDIEHNSALREWLKRYVQKVATTVRGNPYVVISSGNEMVDGDYNARVDWHNQIGLWIKEVSPHQIYTANDNESSAAVWKLGVVDILSVHNCGGIKCDGHDAWYDGIHWNEWQSYNKPVLLDNDGLWQCRTIDNSIAWARLVFPTSGIYGAKGPWPGDEEYPDWTWWNYGIPLLQGLERVRSGG